MNPIRICILLAASWLLPMAVITAATLGAFQRPDIILVSVGILAATMVAFLVGARWATLLATLAEHHRLDDAEVTLEGVPALFAANGHAMLDVLMGVRCRQRRISMGVQTFDPAWIARMGRTRFGTTDTFAAVAAEAGRRGMSTSCDLLINLPGTGEERAVADVDAAHAAGFDQVCVYNLVLSKAISSAWADDPTLVDAMPDNDAAHAVWLAASRRLRALGRTATTLTNHERDDLAPGRRFAYEQLSFDADAVDGIGYGPASRSTFRTGPGRAVKWMEHASSGPHADAMAAHGSAVASTFSYGPDDLALLLITRGLALGSVDLATVSAASGVDVERRLGDLIAHVVDHGLADRDGDHLVLSPRGRFHADAVAGHIAHRRIARLSRGADHGNHHGHM